ncbi:MAG: tryptophan--tRNA ligase, partial [Bacteroidales bacterium]|nr:tryptophan--tRNA ligase [Bacteroidales bacterium]
PQTAELYMFLNMNAYLGELERVTSFKDKVRKQPNNVNAGLLTYPTLMAADIIIHKATRVPVGKDQQQHLEMTRTFASRFNKMYDIDYFPEPIAYNFGNDLVKVPGLDGTGKMGKSEAEGNALFLVDSADIVRKKIMRAKTDAGPKTPNEKKSQEIENIFLLMKLVSKQETINYFEEKYNDCTIRYGDMKKQLAEDMILFTTPIREKILEIESDDQYLRKVVSQGAEKARASGDKTIREVREIIGFKSF